MKLTGVRAIGVFLIALNNEIEVTRYREAFDCILSVVEVAIEKNSASEPLIDTLRTIIELTDAYPHIWDSQIGKFTSLFVSISKSTQYSFDIRAASVENLITITKKISETLKNNSYFLQENLALSFSLITEIDFPFDLDAWYYSEGGLSVANNDA